MYQTTTYPVDSPRPLWTAFSEIPADGENKNDHALVAIARYVRDVRGLDGLDPQERRVVEEVLEDVD